jgi:hypothetical protein
LEIIDVCIGFYVCANQAQVDDHHNPIWRGLRKNAVLLSKVGLVPSPFEKCFPVLQSLSSL